MDVQLYFWLLGTTKRLKESNSDEKYLSELAGETYKGNKLR